MYMYMYIATKSSMNMYKYTYTRAHTYTHLSVVSRIPYLLCSCAYGYTHAHTESRAGFVFRCTEHPMHVCSRVTRKSWVFQTYTRTNHHVYMYTTLEACVWLFKTFLKYVQKFPTPPLSHPNSQAAWKSSKYVSVCMYVCMYVCMWCLAMNAPSPAYAPQQ
jgi:hypothetical protein